MVNVSGICFVLFCLCLRVSIAMPSYDDDNRLAVDKEVSFVVMSDEYIGSSWNKFNLLRVKTVKFYLIIKF